MAKKRRDEKRDPSTGQRVAKFAGAALGVGFGAASLYRRGGSDLLAATIKTGSTIADDLAGKKLTALNIESSLKKRVGKNAEQYKKLVKDYKQGNNKIKFNTKDTRNIFGYLTASKQSRSNREVLKEAHLRDRLSKLQSSQKDFLKKQGINLSDKQNDKLDEILRDAYLNKDKPNGVFMWEKNGKRILKTSDDFHKDGFDFLGDDVKKFKDQLMANAYNARKEANEDLADVYKREEKHLLKKVTDAFNDPRNIAQRLGKKDEGLIGRTNKIINEKTDLDIARAVNNDTRRATLGDLYHEFQAGRTDAFDLDSLKGFVSNRESKNKYDVASDNFDDFMKLMKNNYDELKDVYVGNGVRVREKMVDGQLVKEFYSTNEADEIIKDFMSKVADTMPGRIFKGIDIKQTYNAPLYNIYKEGDIHGFISSKLAHEGEQRLKNTYMSIGKRMYQVTEGGDMRDLVDITDQVGDISVISMDHGSLPRMYKNIIGTDRTTAAEQNKWLRMFDINQTGQPNLWDRMKAYTGKFKNEDWERNRLNSIINEMNDAESKLDPLIRSLVISDDSKLDLYTNIKTLDKTLDAYTAANKISDDTLAKLLYATDEEGNRLLGKNSQAILRGLIKGDIGEAIFSDEAFEEAMTESKDVISMLRVLSTDASIDGNINSLRNHNFRNKRLESLVSKLTSNTESNLDLLNISSKQSKIPFVADLVSTDVSLIDDVMRREVIKEVLMIETDINPDKLFTILDNINLDTGQERSLKVLQNWAKIQSDISGSSSARNFYEEVDLTTKKFFTSMSEYSTEYRNDMSYNMNLVAKDRYGIFDKGTFENTAEQYTSDYGNYTAIKKSSLMSILENLNDFEKFKASVTDVGKELFAGRKNAEDISLLTFAPYFMVSRLNDGIDDLGIGLSHKSAGSTVDLIKNIALKRILPIAGALTAYDYLDYEANNILGTSITGAAANAVGNADMAMRKALDATGMSTVFDWLKQPNVIAEYWTGSNEFQTAEERQDWYENGYSPVRSGRFWSFGSSSEFRGGDISYYQPNFVKRANSNWREIGIYGSAEDKWKHSLIPTLRHPFSTINYLLDPYWLEKKNMDTRPYPLTGKMFAEGTPWGAVLNPTIGELIKPVRMLPEIRERLGSGTVDVKQILHGINERIKAKSNPNDDMLVASGTDIRNAVYTPYAYATPGETLAQINGSNVTLQGVDYMNTVPTVNSTDFVPNPNAIGPIQGAIGNITGDIAYGSYASSGSTEAGRFINNMLSQTQQGENVLNMLKTINADIRNKAATKTLGASMPTANGAYHYNNPVGNMLVSYSNFYEQQNSGLVKTSSLAGDFVADASFSMSQLSGIYGFLGDMAFGEQSYSMRFANAGEMTSFSRGFWDANLGGLGGGFMEIARRFFPHEDRSRVSYNPLRNNMEQWLPERFLTGDAYASLPKGEMRLPGRGYESIHELHPDMFGDYGAFDRMKILGDVAPSSEEYKLWRKIAQQTVTDPRLLKEMKAIEERAQKSMDDHDFYEYRYINNPTDIKKGVIQTINSDGTITLSDGLTLTLAGLEMKDSSGLYEMLSAGETITYRTTKNEVKKYDDATTKAIIYKDDLIPRTSTNINKDLVDMGYAEKSTDSTGLSHLAMASSGQEVIGAVTELIAHAPIPFIHNKFMKIESSLEAYKNEMLYGSSFQTWDHPIEGFVKPAFKQQFRKSMLEEAIAVGSWYAFGKAMKSDRAMAKVGASALMITSNPTALLGGGIGFGLKMGLGGGYFEKGMHLGAAAGHIGWGIANADNPLKAATAFGTAAYYLEDKFEIGEYLATKTPIVKKASDLLERAYKELGGEASEETLRRLSRSSKVLGSMFTLAGVGLGLGISAYKNGISLYDGEGFSFNKPYIPDDVKEKWEMDEYFDRLAYVKYMGLYQEAARRAEKFEDSNIRKVFAQIDSNKKKIAKLQHKAQKLSNKYTSGSPEFQAEITKLQEEIQSLQMSEQVFNGGKYTKAAVAYKKMAESTIYGIDETATMDEILRATPEQYKDYVKAFGNETNKKKREEILELSSPYMRKLLNIAWGEKPDKVESNIKYFGNKKLPSMGWKGWKPNVNIKHVKMKTIENEGMLLSDFGFYDSEKSKAAYYEAPDIENYDSGISGVLSRTNLLTTMSGLGLSLQNVSVEPTSSPGLWIVGDVARNVNDGLALTSYGARSLSNNFINTFL